MDTMKGFICIVGLLIGSFVCVWAQPDGWYYTAGDGTPQGRPIITLADFAAARMDSATDNTGRMVYQIVGRSNDIEAWHRATGKAVGRQLAFVWQGKAICAPRVNMPIESGNFAISSTDTVMRRVYQDITNAIKGIIK